MSSDGAASVEPSPGLSYAESRQSKAKPSLLEYCRGANRWSSERRAKPRLELCRVATEEDKVKEEDEVNLFGLCRVATEEDEVKRR